MECLQLTMSIYSREHRSATPNMYKLFFLKIKSRVIKGLLPNHYHVWIKKRLQSALEIGVQHYLRLANSQLRAVSFYMDISLFSAKRIDNGRAAGLLPFNEHLG